MKDMGEEDRWIVQDIEEQVREDRCNVPKFTGEERVSGDEARVDRGLIVKGFLAFNSREYDCSRRMMKA